MGVKQAVGRYGEALAERTLAEQGWRVLARNWRCPVGEIDIVAVDGRTLVIVEVKTRRSVEFGTALEAVTLGKAARLRKLAAAWLASQDGSFEQIRIDVMGVTLPKSGPATVDHVRGIA